MQSAPYSVCTEKVREGAGNAKLRQRWVHARAQGTGPCPRAGGKLGWGAHPAKARGSPGTTRGTTQVSKSFLFWKGNSQSCSGAEQSHSGEASACLWGASFQLQLRETALHPLKPELWVSLLWDTTGLICQMDVLLLILILSFRFFFFFQKKIFSTGAAALYVLSASNVSPFPAN